MGEVLELKTPEETEEDAYLVTIYAEGVPITMVTTQELFYQVNYEAPLMVRARLRFGIEDIYYTVFMEEILYTT